MRTKTAAILLITGLLQCPAAFGWGDDGHRIVATIAWEYLTPEARATVEALLKDDPGQTLAGVSTWADRARREKQYKWTERLHYVNVAAGADAFDMQRDCPDGNCVVAAIDRFARVLRDANAPVEKRREALKFVTHFVGDVHQPLHVSRARDRGGNDIKVEFFGNKTKLHAVWDSQILRRTKKPWQEYADELRKTITAEQRQAWSASGPAAWATESWQLALSNAYDVPKDGQLGPAYYEKNLPVVEERLKMAGVRLAAVLNGTYEPPPEPPATTQPTGEAAPSTQPTSRSSDVDPQAE